MKKIVLASASPRRRELMMKMGVEFSVRPSDIEENIKAAGPEEMVAALSKGKALDIAGKLSGSHIIIGADTIVAAGGRVLGKPEDEEDAFKMLSHLQGSSHFVYTGVTLLKMEDAVIKEESFSVSTRVEVYPMSDEEIKDYIRSGEPLDKAGAYGIQGLFCKFIKGIEGDYHNVVGLPVSTLYQRLKAF